MKNIEMLLENEYRTAVLTYGFSDRRKLYKLYEAPKHTSVSRKIIISYAVLIAAIIILALTGAAAAYTLRDAVDFRTKDLDITDEKRDEIAENLEEWNTTPEEFATGSRNIDVNKYGETIGNMFDGVDLFTVNGHDSAGDFTGYVYWEDFEYLQVNTTPKNDGTIRNWVYVYNIDGDEIIGKMINHIGFLTNEQLESPDTAAKLRDGDDGEEYTKMAEERLEEKTKNE